MIRELRKLHNQPPLPLIQIKNKQNNKNETKHNGITCTHLLLLLLGDLN